MERGICPIAVLYFEINSVFNTKTVVGQQGYNFFYNSVILSPLWVTWRHRSR